MQNTYINQKPGVVQTSLGFSVSYQNRLLYSKYNPSKSIIQTVNSLQILSGTIVLCFSPLLCYGLKELYEKLPENCILFLCENDMELYDFTIENLKNSILFDFDKKVIKFVPQEELSNLPNTVYDLASSGLYKRTVRIDFSAGTQFHTDFYNQLYDACCESIMTFWKNRITLTKFGRRYSKDLFQNLKILGETTPIVSYFNTVEKPILVFGAGESLDIFLEENSNFDFSDYFILCADTAMQPLLARKIVPDGVFIEESQQIITKAFIGIPQDVHIFAGLSAISTISRITDKKNISFFATQYADAIFFEKLRQNDFFPPVNAPFGSVGITAVYYALKFRKDENTKVFVCGLDFSFSVGKTHAKQTVAHDQRLLDTTKLVPVQNYKAAFGFGAEKIKGKDDKTFITTPSLKTYAKIFDSRFERIKNLFDAGRCGIPLGITKENPAFKNSKNSAMNSENENERETEQHSRLIKIIKNRFSDSYSDKQCVEIEKYLSDERSVLQKLKKLLTSGTKLSEEELKQKITEIACCREYLFLHFADGTQFVYSQSFLNRIRTEIDFFLKILD